VPPDSLLNFIREGLAEDYTATETRTTLGLPGGFLAKIHSKLATLLRQYQSKWQQNNSLLYHRMQLYVLTDGGGSKKVLWRYNDNPIAGHFGIKRTLELVSRKYNWLGMAHKMKAYTRACSTCQRVCPVRHWLQGSMEPLPQPRSPWRHISMNFVIDLQESRQKRHAKPYNAIPVVVYWYTKQACNFPCPNLLDAIGPA
jgi:hypothetical protein